MFRNIISISVVTALFANLPLFAQDSIELAQVDVANSGDTAWILSSTALVLLMTLPGLALFYGGLVRSKNFLSVLIQCGAVAAIASILWVVLGYTIAFGEVSNGFIGGGNAWMLILLSDVREGLFIPESTFVIFQMAFAVITPALMVGAWVERARFGWVVAFCALWGLVVYAPVAHWVWGGGWLSKLGVIDFAGGIVVHTTAGVSALVVAMLVGKRTGWPKSLMLPHSPGLTFVGAALLWVGWFGFNGGSAVAANDDASSAILNTHLAASVASLVWILIEKIKIGKPTTVGWATGAIAGLATITPAAINVSAGGAIIIGILSGIVCFFAIGLIKNLMKIDDSLDVFAVHGVGGMLGSLLVAILASTSFGGTGYGDDGSMIEQLFIQLIGIGSVAVWSAFISVILALAVSVAIPMRASADDERDGLDIANHGERAWDIES